MSSSGARYCETEAFSFVVWWFTPLCGVCLCSDDARSGKYEGGGINKGECRSTEGRGYEARTTTRFERTLGPQLSSRRPSLTRRHGSPKHPVFSGQLVDPRFEFSQSRGIFRESKRRDGAYVWDTRALVVSLLRRDKG